MNWSATWLNSLPTISGPPQQSVADTSNERGFAKPHRDIGQNPRTLVGVSSARGLRGGNVTGGRNTVVRIIGAQVCNRRTIACAPGAGFPLQYFSIKAEIKTPLTP
jgi:hypothetical protein